MRALYSQDYNLEFWPIQGTKKQQGTQPEGLQLRAISVYAISTCLLVTGFMCQNSCSNFRK